MQIFRRGERSTSRLSQAFADLLLFVAITVLIILLLRYNGFIGHSDIQPYPY